MKPRQNAVGLLTIMVGLCISCRMTRIAPIVMLTGRQGPVTPTAIAPRNSAPAGGTAADAKMQTERLPPLSTDELKEYKPNEAGVVPILEYHDIRLKEGWMGRSISNFKNDLERLYDEGYRPISLADYLSNRIDLPAGTSPVVLTFDDARKSQFFYDADGTLDPDCAIAILRDFHDTHPDFPLKATFFILPKCAFEQPNSAEKKLRTLVEWGFELGNHTVRHRMLNKLSDAQVEKEIGGCAAFLHRVVPDARVETVAFPGGHSPRNHKLIAEGNFGGFHYTNLAGFLAASSPAPSPVSKKQDRLEIQRILACEGACGITYWLDQIKNGDVQRYVSDGDPETTTVPRKFADLVDRARLNGATLSLY
jgi:Polysaccharide deacetylase